MTESGSPQSSAIVVRDFGYRFVARDRPWLADISCTIPRGVLVVVAGRTGSGKSTLLRALAGLIPHHAAGEMAGAIDLFGRDTRALGTQELAATAGLVLQNPDEQICTTTVDSEIAFGLANLGLPSGEIARRSETWLARFGLSACRHQATNTLSGGQKQKLLLASILAMGPQLLLFDEPLAQLDPLAVHELLGILDSLRREGLTIVIAEHRLDDLLPRADRVLILDEGRLCANCAAGEPRMADALAATGLVASGPMADASPRHRTDVNESPSIAVVEGLAARVTRHAPPIWQDLNFQIRPGERVAIVGPNGSGKSTLLHALAGFLRPAAGKLEMIAAPPGEAPLALVPQNPDLTLFCSTVDDELRFGPRQFGQSLAEIARRSREVAEKLALQAVLQEAPLSLSQGQRLRIAVGAALTLRPRLLMLDEPTTGQDPQEAQRLLSTIAQSIATGDVGAVLFTTHDLRIAARFATRVLVLAGGRLLADGPPGELLDDAQLMRRASLRSTEDDSASEQPPRRFVAGREAAPGGAP
ncbi:MAG TPA: ABC transporter ATP-binding protein [Pirellulales bacterium]|nr:ABC transporter ATP-binding protein [Pirellulales bacterium]